MEQWFTCGLSARPVTPRGLRGANRVLYWAGDERTTGWTKFVTRIRALDF